MSASEFLWLEAHSFVHVGAPAAGAVIDLPVARESTTGYPYIPGSGLKGALRDTMRAGRPEGDKDPEVVRVFGASDDAGSVLISDARLAFLPLRSLQASYVLATCPTLLRRLVRDLAFAGRPLGEEHAKALTSALPDANGALSGFPEQLFVEEFVFRSQSSDPMKSALTAALDGHESPDQIVARVVVLRDEDFGFFARRRVPVRMRNALEPEKKTVVTGALWTEESMAPDTLLYAVLTPRRASLAGGVEAVLESLRATRGYLQVGGNETVGEGWLYAHGRAA